MDISDFVIDECTVSRYRLNYGLGADINAGHVAKHLRLENELTNRLLVSSPETRWKTFHDCYTILYKELPPSLATSPKLYKAIVDRFRVMTPFLQFLTASFAAHQKKPNALAMFA